MGTALMNEIPLYSPFIKSIKVGTCGTLEGAPRERRVADTCMLCGWRWQVLQPAFLSEGKKRVRRAKLYYLWEKRDPKEYTLTG